MAEKATVVRRDERAFFRQGDIEFEVDAHDLFKVLGAGGFKSDGSVLDKLSDATLVNLARANDLDVSPYSRELVTTVLLGVIQNTWYRDLKNYTSENLEKNHHRRLHRYARELAELRAQPEVPATISDGHTERPRPGVRRRDKFTTTYEVSPNVKLKQLRGREQVILTIVHELGQPTFAQIVDACGREDKEGKTRLKAKDKRMISRTVTYFVNHAVKTGLLKKL